MFRAISSHLLILQKYGQNFVWRSSANCKHFSVDRTVAVDGINVNVREGGNGDHVVLLLPGLLGTIDTEFGKVMRKMNPSKFRLVCWDPPGYGKSRPFIKSHEGDFYAKDANLLVKLMNKLDYKKFSIVGYGNGGITGGALAANYPESATKLVMFSALAYCDEESVAQAIASTNTEIWPASMKLAMNRIYDEMYLDGNLKNYTECLQKTYTRGNTFVTTDRYRKIQCPTLVMHGDGNEFCSMKQAQYLSEHIENCQLHVIKGGKHNIQITHTQGFVSLIESFLLA